MDLVVVMEEGVFGGEEGAEVGAQGWEGGGEGGRGGRRLGGVGGGGWGGLGEGVGGPFIVWGLKGRDGGVFEMLGGGWWEGG